MDAPDFELYDLKSQQQVRLSDFKGQPVMITFWVSWCPDCGRDLPQKAQFYRSLDTSTLGFLSINVTGREPSPEDGPKYAKEHELPFPVLIDNSTEVYDAFGCSSVPTTIILDKEHQMINQFGDTATFYEIMEALSIVLA